METLMVLLTARSFRVFSAMVATRSTREGSCWYYLVLAACSKAKPQTFQPVLGRMVGTARGPPVEVTFAATSSQSNQRTQSKAQGRTPVTTPVHICHSGFNTCLRMRKDVCMHKAKRFCHKLNKFQGSLSLKWWHMHTLVISGNHWVT